VNSELSAQFGTRSKDPAAGWAGSFLGDWLVENLDILIASRQYMQNRCEIMMNHSVRKSDGIYINIIDIISEIDIGCAGWE
jgi:hypothetical protein